jgi:hypothetical protein
MVSDDISRCALDDEAVQNPVRWLRPWGWPGWVWAAALGIGTIAAGLLGFAIAVTSVVLPYELRFVGLDHRGIDIVNSRVVPFMRHDRIVLAGTAIALGVIYTALAWKGMREQWGWSRYALLYAGVAEFSSMFLFMVFSLVLNNVDYVDPTHVIVSATLFPLFILAMVRPFTSRVHPSLGLTHDQVGKRDTWGQLLFVTLGTLLVGPGAIIWYIGITTVFVQSDLSFLDTSPDRLTAASARIVPLIAHDRAGFGGSLATNGIAVALVALWGYRRGARWIWWTLLVSGGLGFSCGLFAHVIVGYLEPGHLFPLYFSGMVFLAALWLSRPYLRDRVASLAS